jgi:coenzyme F420 biosynthesis associated uncharacterized protein
MDWKVAAKIGGSMAAPGPVGEHAELRSLVDGLRSAAKEAVPHVIETAQLSPASGDPDTLGDVFVVDRPGWITANAQVFAAMSSGLGEALPQAVSENLESMQMAASAEMGAILAIMSPRVLGQFDPYSALLEGPGVSPVSADDPGSTARLDTPPTDTQKRGRLLLVAPNMLSTERAMQVDPADYRLWVCLHEQTHALQFGSAPWLAPHMRERIGSLFSSTLEAASKRSEEPLHTRIVAGLKSVYQLLAGTFSKNGPAPFERALSPEARAELADLTAVMALLEGHADVMMDAVGPAVVPSVAEIRRKFEVRRDSSRGMAQLLQRLMGMDAKLAQYRDGAAFVRAVEARVGRSGFNAAFASAENLPTASDILCPADWITRVHG